MFSTDNFNFVAGIGLLLALVTIVAALANLYALVKQMRRSIQPEPLTPTKKDSTR